jgi:hypothetical protein
MFKYGLQQLVKIRDNRKKHRGYRETKVACVLLGQAVYVDEE